jgi:hypothetical protein
MDDTAARGRSSGTSILRNNVQDVSGYPIDIPGNAAFPSLRISHPPRLSRRLKSPSPMLPETTVTHLPRIGKNIRTQTKTCVRENRKNIVNEARL